MKIVIIFCMILLFFCSCNQNIEYETTTQNKITSITSIDNIVSGTNSFVPDTNAINKIDFKKDTYYYLPMDDYLYIVCNNKNIKAKLINDFVMHINVINDYLYYFNMNDYYIYKMKRNGSNVQKLSKGYYDFLYYYNNNLYFANEIEGKAGYEVFKISLDGKVKNKVFDEIVESFYVQDGNIYYSLANGKGLYKYNIGSGIKTKISNDFCYEIVVDNEWIYFTNEYLYKIKVDGTGKNKLSEDMAENIYIEDNYIYYANENVYKILKNGSHKTKISEEEYLKNTVKYY